MAKRIPLPSLNFISLKKYVQPMRQWVMSSHGSLSGLKSIVTAIVFVFALGCQAPVWAACAFNAVGTKGEAASGDITLGAPGSPATNDVWIAVITTADAVAHTLTDWTEIQQEQGVGSGVNPRQSVWRFRYAGSTPNLIVGHTAGNSIVGQIAAFRGCKTTGDPVDTEGTINKAGEDDTPTFNGITPTASNTLLLAALSYGDDLAVSADPSGFTNAFSALTSLNNDAGAYLWYKDHVSGATGDFGATMTAQTSNDDYIALLLALAPEVTRRAVAPIIFQ